VSGYFGGAHLRATLQGFAGGVESFEGYLSPNVEMSSLWYDVDAPAVESPTVTRDQVLPFGSLSWENFERLCFRLAHRDGDVEEARLYGERGQAQEGIDLYIRYANGDYATWQCKRHQEIETTDIEKAVTRFLEGGWASRTKVFRLAVAPSLNATKLAEEIENQRIRCQAKNIAFKPLDRDHLSVMLKGHPDLVDDFFGRAWVEAFNGFGAAAALAGRKLSREQRLNARGFIQALYTTHFKMIDGGIPAAARAFCEAVPPVPVFDRYVEPTIELVESIIEQEQVPTSKQENKARDTAQRGSVKGFRKREIRTKLALSAGLASSDRFLLLGGAGFGKSAALRVVIHSLLSGHGRFPALAKEWGQRLPLLLPFGFLTRHFAENVAPTIEAALKAWLMVLGARNDSLTLLEEMLEDDRLLLLVDGLDEWQNREAAVTALTALTTYVQTRRLPLVATGRPLGFQRISDFGPDWKRASLLPLSSDQQREFANHWFRHFYKVGAALDTLVLEQAVTREATGFTYELSEDPTLSELGGVPLLLSVMIYLRLAGYVLPRSRLAAVEELVKALLEDQPRRRAQAAMQLSDQTASRSRRIRQGIEYLAYRVHQEPNSISLPNERAVQLLTDFYHTSCELPLSEADDWAVRVLELGRHEFGVLATPQEHHVGLLHRIFQEYLAAKYLERLSLDEVKRYCANTGFKSPWHEVTLTLIQLLNRQDDVDQLIDELRKPAADSLDEPLQQILLTRVAVTETNCSPSKARELLLQVFSWIECGRWMPLRRKLVAEVAAGLESEQVAASLSARATRWFPGRVWWRHDIPTAAAKQPTAETVSDLRLALYNCNSPYEHRNVAEALASLSEESPDLADELMGIIRGPADPEIMGAALHAFATGWPTHGALPSLLKAASASPAKELRLVAILARFRLGERSHEVRDALVDFTREWLWPWDKDIVNALVTGWPREPQLISWALKSALDYGYRSDPAIEYLLRGCPGDDQVASMLADLLAKEKDHYPSLDIHEIYEPLLAGFTGHPLLVPAAEAWLDKNAAAHHSPMDIAVIAKLGGTLKCRQALFDQLRQHPSMPAWTISTLLEMSERNDPEVHTCLADYISDEQRRSRATRWLPDIVSDPTELGVMLRTILRDAHAFDSCEALKILVDKEGCDAPDLWSLVESRLCNDKDGHYWRLGGSTISRIWPNHPLIRQLVKSNIYSDDLSLSELYQVYGNDSEIRALLDSTMRVLHEDLRVEFAQSIEPLVRRGVPAAVAIAAEFRNETNDEARTIAARAYARACVREGPEVKGLIEALSEDLTRHSLGTHRQQAAASALLELGRADLLAQQQEDGRPLRLDTHSKAGHNWEFVATVVEHWESLAHAVPDIWERFSHSPIIAAELAKAGKGAHALSQAQIFETAVRTGAELQVEHVRALIAMHGRSALLRDLFLDRLKFMVGQKSMVVSEEAAYTAMASYLVDHFRGDEAVGEVVLSLSTKSLIYHIALVALCRGWPDAPAIIEASEKLPTLMEGGSEPFTAWLFATRADAALMARYIMLYPGRLTEHHFGNPRDGTAAVRDRLRSDKECRDMVFAELRNTSDLDARIAVAKLLAPSMRNDRAFRDWISGQVRGTREDNSSICRLVFDVLANTYKPVEFALFEAALTGN
jgi:hypothetical protein